MSTPVSDLVLDAPRIQSGGATIHLLDSCSPASFAAHELSHYLPRILGSTRVDVYLGLAGPALAAASFDAWLAETIALVDWMGKVRVNCLFVHFNRLPPGDLSPLLPELEKRGIDLELG